MFVIKRDGSKEEVKLEKITKRITRVTKDLKNVDAMEIVQKTISGLYDGVTSRELDNLAIETSAYLSARHPEYDKLATRLAVSALHKETDSQFSTVIDKLYKVKDSRGKSVPMIADDVYKIVKKHAHVLDSAIDYKRDFNYDYFGFKTLEKSYLLRVHEYVDGKKTKRILERPQHMLMRVAVGIHKNDIDAAVNTYNMMSKLQFTHATPTLFNAGTPRNQLSSCFLLMMQDDSIEGIYNTLKQCALISQSAGGIGLAVSNIRPAGSPIYGTGGISNGLVPMLRNFNETARYVDQCFTGETLIETENGMIEIQHIKIGDKIKTTDGFQEVLGKKQFSATDNMVIMTTEDNKRVESTSNHIFLVIRNANHLTDEQIKQRLKDNVLELEWVEAKEITNDDVIVKAK